MIAPQPEAIREQLRRILESSGFVRSDRLRRFLTHCVESTLAGRLDDLKEYTIGLVAFDRPKHYNPAEDPIVRVEARRLRKKLEEYYETQGKDDPVVIQVPKGGYLPTFELRHQPASRSRPRALLFAFAGMLICAVALLWISRRPRQASVEPVLTRMTNDRELNTDPALSSDGSLLVFASDRAGSGGLDIWIQPARAEGARNELRRLTNDPADDSQPAISPDKSMVAFRSERQPPGIYVAGLQGGPARLLVRDGRNPRFSPDGNWIAYWTGSPGGGSLPPAGKVSVIPSRGGASRTLLAGFSSAACPAWSTRDSRLLIEAAEKAADPLDLWSVGLDEGRPVRVGLVATLESSHLKLPYHDCSFTWNGDAVVISLAQQDTQNLWRVPVSRQGQVQGRLVHFTLGSAREVLPVASASGSVAFASRSETLGIWRMPVEQPDRLVRLTDGEFPAVVDGRLVYLAKAAGRTDVWLKDLGSGKETQMTRAPTDPRYPQLCPGRDEIVYSEGPDAFLIGVRQPSPRRVCDNCSRVWQCTGRELLYSGPPDSGRAAIASFELDTGVRTRLLAASDFDLAGVQKSSDGWLVFHAILGPDKRQIFTADVRPPYPIARERWIPVSDGTQLDRNAVWNETDDRLYFLSERCGFRCIWTQQLDAATKRPVGPPSPVRHFHFARQGLSSIGDVGAIGLGYQDRNLYFSMSEASGDIWMARP